MSEPTPLYEAATAAGAAFAEDAGWLMPAHFGDPAAEYRLALESAALFDLCHRGKVELSGPDASSFLHNLCTNEIKQLAVGTGCEAFLTSPQAKTVSYAYIYRAPASLWLDVVPGTAEKVVAHLDHYRVTEQVDLADRTHAYAQLHLAGPEARAVLDRVVANGFPDLPELGHLIRPWGEHFLIIRRHQALGVSGYDLLCPVEAATLLWQALTAAAARPAGLQAYQTLRVEAGTPVFGSDIDDTNLPQEVGRIERTISFTKGCYIGQETVARIRTYGHVNRQLVGLQLASAPAVAAGAKVYRDDQEVGRVTSSVVSPRLGAAIALAYVRRGSQEPGTAVQVETAAGRCTGQVVALPFVGSPSST